MEKQTLTFLVNGIPVLTTQSWGVFTMLCLLQAKYNLLETGTCYIKESEIPGLADAPHRVETTPCYWRAMIRANIATMKRALAGEITNYQNATLESLEDFEKVEQALEKMGVPLPKD